MRRSLHRRYGHARSPSKLRGHRLFWNGPGSSIRWVAPDGFMAKSPAIDGPFNSLKEATAAVKGYLA